MELSLATAINISQLGMYQYDDQRQSYASSKLYLYNFLQILLGCPKYSLLSFSVLKR